MPVAVQTERRLPDLLIRNRNFVLLWAAYGVSAFGDHLSEMALLQEAGGLLRDDVTRVQALMTFCFFLPFVVVGPLAGWWADRFSRKTTMIAADVIRAAIMLSIPFMLGVFRRAAAADLTASPADRTPLVAVALPLLMAGAFAAFFSPARQALVPTLIRDDQLVRANAMISGLGTIGAILSAVVGGWLVDLSGRSAGFSLEWNYRLDALTFLFSAVLLSGIAMSRSRALAHELPAGVWTPLRQGFRYVWQHRRVLQIILLGTVFWAAAGVIISVVPAIVRDVFGGNFTQAGLYRGFIAAGLATGAVTLTIVGRTAPIPLIVLAAVLGSGFWVGLLDVVYALRLGPVWTGICLFMTGVHGAGILVTVSVIIQRFVPDSHRGRVFGISDVANMLATVAATGLLGLPHIEHLDRYIPWLLGIVAAGMLVSGWLAWREYRRGDPHPATVWLLWRVLRFYAAFWLRARRVGVCTVPRAGPVIIAANHSAGIDPLTILATSPHRLPSFLVAREYCRGVTGWFIRLGGCIAVNRSRPGKDTLDAALHLLERGGCLGVFPQGRFEPPDERVEARPGIGLLALRSAAVVIPCHISGASYTETAFGSFVRRQRVRVRYGSPVDLRDLRRPGRERDRGAQQLASARIMAAIRALSPEPQEPAPTVAGAPHGA
ncbi:MAG: MFS transporter [Planctomycetota bacterium]